MKPSQGRIPAARENYPPAHPIRFRFPLSHTIPSTPGRSHEAAASQPSELQTWVKSNLQFASLALAVKRTDAKIGNL